MVKKILYIANLLLSCSHCIASNPSLFEKDDNFVKGFVGNNRINIGVVGVSYLISPAEDDKAYLQFRNGHLEISKELSQGNLFYFERMEKTSTRFSLKSRLSQKVIKDETGDPRDKCLIVVQAPNTYEMLFERYKGDARPFRLQHHPRTSQVSLNGKLQADEGVSWHVRPAYKCLDLNPSQVDPETLLFKISRKEKISNNLLSPQQVHSLYTLYRSHQDNMPLTLVHTTDEFVYGHTPELAYLKGVYFSADFSLEVSNIKGLKVGISKNTLREAKDHACIEKGNSRKVKKNETVFLMPQYTDTNDSVPLLGNIEITFSHDGWFSSSNVEGLRLEKLINNQKISSPNFAVHRRHEDTFHFVDINKNPVFNPGRTGWWIKQATDDSIEKLGKEVARPLAISIESLGKSIEVASKNAENALIESSRNFSDGMKISAATLSDTVKFASCSFENAVKTLSFTANGISKDVQKNLPFVLNNIHNTTRLLTSALTEASENLREGAHDASQALENSSRCFESAFDGVGQALRDGTGDITRAIETASQNFITGMENVKEAAEKLSNVKVKHSICSIS